MLSVFCIKYRPKIDEELKSTAFVTLCTWKPTVHLLCPVTPEWWTRKSWMKRENKEQNYKRVSHQSIKFGGGGYFHHHCPLDHDVWSASLLHKHSSHVFPLFRHSVLYEFSHLVSSPRPWCLTLLFTSHLHSYALKGILLSPTHKMCPYHCEINFTNFFS